MGRLLVTLDECDLVRLNALTATCLWDLYYLVDVEWNWMIED